MLKEIIGVTVSVILAVYMLWFIVPGLKTAYNGILTQVNQTNPIVSNVLVVSNGWFTILPLFVVIVAGFSIWLYATRREGADY